MNLAPKGLLFIGAEIVLATVKLRLSEIPQARAFVFSFLDRISSSNHMYRDCAYRKSDLQPSRHAKPETRYFDPCFGRRWTQSFAALQNSPGSVALKLPSP